MKKILIALALIASVQIASAQTKSPAAAKKAIESAEYATADLKKAAKTATWLNLSKAYMDAYNAPIGSVWVGMGKQELGLIESEKPLATEMVTLNGEQYEKMTFSTKDLYFNMAGQLAIIDVTAPVCDDPLAGALKGYKTAAQVDAKNSKIKDVTEGIKGISEKYTTEAINKYNFGDLTAASLLFEKAADALATPPVSQFDTVAVYNAGFTAYFAGDYPRAKRFFRNCYEHEYYYEGGDVFAKLSDLYKRDGDTTKCAEILKEGFSKFPESQVILVNLINYYLESGQNQEELFSLLDAAKKNEPNNPSLYYVEGNIRLQLGQEDRAIEAYSKCNEVDPNYENGFIGIGILYYNKAVAISEEAANEFDDNKYMALVDKFEQTFMSAIDPFEKAYAISQNDDVKINICAESLKNIYYRFRDKDPKYQAGYDKYNEVIKAAKGE